MKWISIKAQLFKEKDGQRHFYCVFVDITDEKRLQERENELFEKELTYFAEISAAEGIHGRINLTQNVVESYMATSDAAIARVGDSYDRTIENLADSAMDADYGEKIRKTLNRDQVLAAFENGKSDYHFEYFRRRNGSGAFLGKYQLPLLHKSGKWRYYRIFLHTGYHGKEDAGAAFKPYRGIGLRFCH